MILLQLLLIAVLTIRTTVVVSFSTLPQNSIRHGRQSTWRPSVSLAATPSKTAAKHSRRRRRKKRVSVDKKKNKDDYVHDGIEIWRVYGLSVHPDALAKDEDISTKGPKKASESIEKIPKALEKIILGKFRLDSLPTDTKIVRRSLDARKKLDYPRYSYVVDIPIEGSLRHSLGWKVKSGQLEKLRNVDRDDISSAEQDDTDLETADVEEADDSEPKKNVIVVGMGPAGLFCALQIALNSNGKIRPILMDRGKPVENRGQDIGRLMHRRHLNEESNFAFGEGGAGTWSDGKLTTRIGRNSDTVRLVLETLVEFGAPSNILWKGAPHLGTDNLVRLLRNMRFKLAELGGEILFETKMTNLKMEDGKVCGVYAEDADGNETYYAGDEVVLATGHSARDVYESLHSADVKLEPKGFACGFRIEHPQKIINQIQYGDEWGPSVKTGKALTDAANEEFFGSEPTHVAKMPVPSYRLATDKAVDGTEGNLRGVYSFCMCPVSECIAQKYMLVPIMIYVFSHKFSLLLSRVDKLSRLPPTPTKFA